MDFLKLAAKRQSCRAFDAREVEKEKIRQILDIARIAPSACNAQPWSFVAVQGEKKKEVQQYLQRPGANQFVNHCPVFVLIVEEEEDIIPKVSSRFGKNAFAALDIGIATAHIVFAAEELGLATCIIGWIEQQELKEALGIPQQKTIRIAIALGYASKENGYRKKQRKAFDEVVTFVE